MNLETVRISKIINGGFGLGHLPSGQIILVRHALPGETVTVMPEETQKSYLVGRIHSVEAEHAGRRTPPCSYYYQCGGCDLQHCDYDTQVTIKKNIVRDLFQRQNSDDVRLATRLVPLPLPSASVWGYRQRIRLRIGKHGEVGFHRYRSHDIVPIDQCLLAGEALNRALKRLKNSESARSLLKLSSEVELLLNPLSEKVVCIFSFTRQVRPADMASARLYCAEDDGLESVFFKGTDYPLCGPFGSGGREKAAGKFGVHYPQSQRIARPLLLTWEAGGFCQVNLTQNRSLIETVIDFSRITVSENILDLYCGMGNFAVPMAMLAKSVLGIEGQGSAIRSAVHNAELAGLHNTSFLKKPTHIACTELVGSNRSFDCVVLDPPRQGAPGLADALATICSNRLVYVSCDPATLCRDLASLCLHGFTVSRIQPVDMFPQTHHIETVVLLER